MRRWQARGAADRLTGLGPLAGILTAVLLLSVLLAPHYPLVFVVIALLLSAALTLVAARRARGGWRWHWGDGD